MAHGEPFPDTSLSSSLTALFSSHTPSSFRVVVDGPHFDLFSLCIDTIYAYCTLPIWSRRSPSIFATTNGKLHSCCDGGNHVPLSLNSIPPNTKFNHLAVSIVLDAAGLPHFWSATSHFREYSDSRSSSIVRSVVRLLLGSLRTLSSTCYMVLD